MFCSIANLKQDTDDNVSHHMLLTKVYEVFYSKRVVIQPSYFHTRKVSKQRFQMTISFFQLTCTSRGLVMSDIYYPQFNTCTICPSHRFHIT